ncbi:MAG TPA: PQQ-binding-like beta-propeller repeat protein [Jatrophihabitans sp.]|nr:PQQ-binding-like beta-propeller repeat protein [Jatrophihabitans sp.]
MTAAHGPLRIGKRYSLDGNVYASPLVIGGRVVVATEHDTVYAIDHGHVVWRRHLGTPAPQSQLPCGNIFPLGITGTPVYRRGLIYVAAEFGGPPRHRLFALRLSTGHVVWRHTLDQPGVETRAMQERGALTYAGGRIWVPFGGLAGDCAGYKGRVVGVRIHGAHHAIKYTVPTQREAGIWTPPGPAWGGKYLFVAVGNGAATSPPYDKSDSVLAIGKRAHLHQFFAPRSWPSDNAADLDLGSQGPALVGKWVFADGKRGRAYVLRRSHLGGVGGAVTNADLCTSFGGTAVVKSRVYVPCTDGVRAVRIGRHGHLHRVWHAASSITGSPVVGGGRVWALNPDAGVLYALGPRNGNVVRHIDVGATSRFATPALYGHKVLVPTLTGLTVVYTS